MELTSKVRNLLTVVNQKLKKGQYRYAAHASLRLQERKVTRLEVRQALQNGSHEEIKDKFNHDHKLWNYSIRGKTIDGRSLRVIVSFDKKNMLIITVINL